MSRERTWYLIDHLCRACGGRILQCATGQGPTGGGNPIYKCADCGVSTSARGPSALCWCGMQFRNNHLNPYVCLPFSILKEKPELREAFLAFGCDPDRGEVGILNMETWKKYD